MATDFVIHMYVSYHWAKVATREAARLVFQKWEHHLKGDNSVV
jgi:hypothetical protein